MNFNYGKMNPTPVYGKVKVKRTASTVSRNKVKTNYKNNKNNTNYRPITTLTTDQWRNYGSQFMNNYQTTTNKNTMTNNNKKNTGNKTPAKKNTTYRKSFSDQVKERLKINGKIDTQVKQGQTGDCGLLSGVLSLAATQGGRELIENAISINSDGSVKVTFNGVGKSYNITDAEIRKHDTDKNTRDTFSNGGNDMLVLELAFQKLFRDMPNEFLTNDNKKTGHYAKRNPQKNDDFGIKGTKPSLVYKAFTGKAGDTCSVHDIKNKTQKNAEIKNFLKKKLKNPNIAMTVMLNSNKNAEAKLLNWDLKNPDKPNSSRKQKTFSFNSGGADSVHAFSIEKVTQNTVTIVNPWDSSKKYKMTYDEFCKLDVSYLESSVPAGMIRAC